MLFGGGAPPLCDAERGEKIWVVLYLYKEGKPFPSYRACQPIEILETPFTTYNYFIVCVLAYNVNIALADYIFYLVKGGGIKGQA
jgi:hypothetical protein